MINDRINLVFGRLGNRLFQLANIYALARGGQLPDIYLQDHTAFDNYRSELQALLAPQSEKLNYVSLHVRRGKNPSNPSEPAYSENSFYVNLTNTDYYTKAMKEFPSASFMVFSDDIPWCIDNLERLPGCEYAFTHGDEQSDFETMALCHSHIIANSSYSWWAAYLGGGDTIAPSEWFSDKVNRVTYPKEWKVV